MISLSLRLTLRGGREAIVRLVVMTIGVALGVALLLITLAGINAVNAQNARYAWLETGAGPQRLAAGHDPLWWSLHGDLFHGQVIGRVDLAATGPDSPVPPGIPNLPRPGQFYASPAMARLLASAPAEQLAARYPGRQVGTIAPAALPSPDSLVIVIGRTVHALAANPDATRVTSISTTTPSSCNGSCYFIGIDASGIDLVLSVAAAALIFPVLVFIGAATRLSAARREQRFAAIRLVGATPRQITVISTVESTVAAAVGTLAGFVGFFLLRPLIAQIPFTGSRFFVDDLSLNVPHVLVVALGVPAAAAVAARIALRRVTISPLGVSRRVTPRPPRAWRLLPLVAGVAELYVFVLVGRPSTTPGQITAYLTGILTMLVGLVFAGPWLTMVGARLMVRRAQRPAALIAGRRLGDNPQTGFRAVSGLVLALFVTSVAIALITAIEAYGGPTATDDAARATLVQDFADFRPDGTMALTVHALPVGVLAGLRDLPGVRGVTVVHADPASATAPFGADGGLVSCAELARTPALGRCVPGATTGRILGINGLQEPGARRVWSATATPLAGQPVRLVAVTGPPAAVEQARTLLERAFPFRSYPTTIAEDYSQRRSAQLTAQYRRLVDVVVLTSLPIAGCSLAVSVVAGISERRRAFSVLRLTGTPIRLLRRVIALESAVPLVLLSMLSIAAGFLAAGLFLRSQLDETFHAPSLGYWLCVGAGLLFSLGIIATTLPLLRRTTGPEVARND